MAVKDSLDNLANFLLKPVDSFAKKGSPGVLLLSILFGIVAYIACLLILKGFNYIGTLNETFEIDGYTFAAILVVYIILLVIFVLLYRLAKIIISNIVSVTKADAEAQYKLSKTFGGKAILPSGQELTQAITAEDATKNTILLMRALIRRAEDIGLKKVRANIFTLNADESGYKLELKIKEGLQEKMDLGVDLSKELSINIPFGHLSTGRAMKYFRPVFSVKASDGSWPHVPGKASKALVKEIEKADPELKWIISMPVPCKVKPQKICCGVLSLDCLGETINEDEFKPILRQLLADQSTAAAFIGLMNKNIGFLEGFQTVATEIPATEEKKGQLTKYMVSWKDYDPVKCPPPSEEFISKLSNIEGFEFMQGISPKAFSLYLREQLAS